MTVVFPWNFEVGLFWEARLYNGITIMLRKELHIFENIDSSQSKLIMPILISNPICTI